MHYESYEQIAHIVDEIEGLLVIGQEKFLFDMVRGLPEDAVIVEIGSYLGKSTVCMGLACKGTGRRIYAIDTWDGNDKDFDERNFYFEWVRNIIVNGLEQHVIAIPGRSSDVMRLWGMITDNMKIDFVFIDGSHQYEDVMADFCNCYDHVKENGWIVMHDIKSERYPGVDRVWDELAGRILVDQKFHTTLGAGRKKGPLPRWARLNADKLMRVHGQKSSE